MLRRRPGGRHEGFGLGRRRGAAAADGLLVLFDHERLIRIDRVLFIYSADRHFESTRDAVIDLRSGAVIEAKP